MTRILSTLLIILLSTSSWAQELDCPALLSPKRQASIMAANSAGLNYRFTRPEEITRKALKSVPSKNGKLSKAVFDYFGPDGNLITDERTIRRLNKLAVPPAWKDVAFSEDPEAHIQAIGRDDAGRIQYRYHEAWNEVRRIEKFDHIFEFGKALPELRQQTERDLSLRMFSREKVLALLVRLLEKSLIRVGSDEYALENGTFGLTTLEKRHVTVTGAKIEFNFIGKENISHQFWIRDQRLAKMLSQLLQWPGTRLFQYADSAGELRPLSAGDVNAYIQSAIGAEFSAKNFRTWMATVLAARALKAAGPAESPKQAKANIKLAMEYVAGHLRNKPSESKASYVHPIVLSAYLDGRLFDAYELHLDDEAAVLWILD